MEKVCHNCEKAFETNINKKKFCSDNCRVMFSRKKLEDLDEKFIIPPEQKYFTPANQLFFDKFGQPTEKAGGETVTVHLTEKDYVIKTTNEFEWEKQQAGLPYFDEKKIKQRIGALSWVKEIEKYCELASCIPQDLIDAHRNLNKPFKKLKQFQDEEIKQSNLGKKLGISQKPEISDFHKKLMEKKLKHQHNADR